MRTTTKGLLLLALLAAWLQVVCPPALAQGSPFGGGAQSERTVERLDEIGPIARLSIYLQRQQQIFYRRLNNALREVRSGGSTTASFALISLAFLYGVFHAAGPGHGKAVISAYTLANERSVRRGAILAALASVAQAVTAIVAVYGLLLALGATGSAVRAVAANLEVASFALVALLGLAMLYRAARPLFAGVGEPGAGGGHTHRHAPDETCQDCGHSHMPAPALVDRPLTARTALPIVASIGLRPCTGAVVVLVFAHTLGLYLAGIAATFAMAAGTAITVASLAGLAVTGRDLAGRLFTRNNRLLTGFYRTVAIAGSLAVLTLGLLLLHGALTAPGRVFV